MSTPHDQGSPLKPASLHTCNANAALAEEIAGQLGLQLSPLEISRFSNDNLHVKICDNVRERDVFVVQPF